MNIKEFLQQVDGDIRLEIATKESRGYDILQVFEGKVSELLSISSYTRVQREFLNLDLSNVRLTNKYGAISITQFNKEKRS